MRPVKNKNVIVEASLKLFCEKGFNDTSIKEITDEAGVSAGNVYNHFKSKEELFDHLFQVYFPGNHIESLIKGVSSKKCFDENIANVLNNITTYIENNPYFFKLIIADANDFGGKHLRKYGESYFKPIEEYLENSQGLPELRKDIGSLDFTAFFSWLFYCIGLAEIVYVKSTNSNLKNTPVYNILLKVLQKGLRE